MAAAPGSAPSLVPGWFGSGSRQTALPLSRGYYLSLWGLHMLSPFFLPICLMGKLCGSHE